MREGLGSHQIQRSSAQEAEGALQGWTAGGDKVLREWQGYKLCLGLIPDTFPWLGWGSPTYPLQIEDRGHLGEPGKLVSDGPGGHRGKIGNE